MPVEQEDRVDAMREYNILMGNILSTLFHNGLCSMDFSSEDFGNQLDYSVVSRDEWQSYDSFFNDTIKWMNREKLVHIEKFVHGTHDETCVSGVQLTSVALSIMQNKSISEDGLELDTLVRKSKIEPSNEVFSRIGEIIGGAISGFVKTM